MDQKIYRISLVEILARVMCSPPKHCIRLVQCNRHNSTILDHVLKTTKDSGYHRCCISRRWHPLIITILTYFQGCGMILVKHIILHLSLIFPDYPPLISLLGSINQISIMIAHLRWS